MDERKTKGSGRVERRQVLARGDVVDVRVEKLVAGGDGLARHEGLPIFVARSAPGDRVRVEITASKPSYARAEIVELLAPGDGRREPRCRHFGECGGCDLQHLDDELQVEYKVAATLETLERIGKIAVPAPEVLTGSPWGYRGRTQLHVEPAPGDDGSGRAAVGYHRRESHRVVPILECPVLVPELETAARRLGAALPPAPPLRIDLTIGDDGTLTGAPRIDGLPHGEVTARVGKHVYAFDSRCFFQGNRDLLGRLVDVTLDGETGTLAVDLYAGVGLFALPLAAKYERVIAVEGDRLAARYGRINARRNGAPNIDVVHRAVESWVPELPLDCDRVIVDPPRSGLLPPILAAIVSRRPRAVTYVSCHPAALARDLRALSEAYEIRKLTLIDLFPQTGHIEVVTQLAARGGTREAVEAGSTA